MKVKHVIYHCYGSAHSSVIAAAIHLGQLPHDQPISAEDIVQCTDFDIARDDSLGHLFFKGHDEDGRAVYTIGMGPEQHIVKRSILSMLHINQQPQEQFYFASALPHINNLAKFGGALSRRYGLTAIGRKMAAIGCAQSYPRLVQFVSETKRRIKALESS